MFRNIPLALAATLVAVGCQHPPLAAVQPQDVEGAVFVSGTDREAVWERAVDVLHDYPFEIARENKLDGVIETEYKVGAGLTEPWHKDSVGFYERLHSSLQSIRRRVFITIQPVEGGFIVAVRAEKELENLVGLAANSAGGATFQDNSPLQRDLNVVVGQTTPSGWVPQGRDFRLERDLDRRLRRAFSR